MEGKSFYLIVFGFIATLVLKGDAASVKLTGGIKTNSLHYGILQVYHNGEWGTVCDDGWNSNNSKVVCGQLGYTTWSSYMALGQGSGKIWLDDVSCSGSERSIDNCNHTGWGNHNCDHGEDVGIVCHSGLPNMAFRLTDKPFAYHDKNVGRPEVRYYGTWGALCSDYFSLQDAHVVCRMLGYRQAVLSFGFRLRVSAVRFSLQIHCIGNESSIEECSKIQLHKINKCDNNKVPWIVCKTNSVQHGNLAVRLKNASTPNQGRVEVQYYGVWGTVCDDYWGLEDAHVVCRMLNYSKATWAGTAKVKGSGPILLDDVMCRGNERSLEYCRNRGWGQHNCDHSEDAGVKCENLTEEELSVTVRLVGEEQKHFGLVEGNYNGTWRPVCDDTWDILDAHVICRMLGYKAALAAIRQYMRGNSSVWMGGVECSGEEVSISECYHRGWFNTRCPGNYYAGVMCQGVTKDLLSVQVRLEDGSSPNSGRVAVRYGNVWGTICNRGLDINDAKVICRMLGYVGGVRQYTSKPGNGTIWLSNLGCNGTEKSIVDCRHPGWGQTTCNHYFDSVIRCKKADPSRFKINGEKAIRLSTVVILFNDSQPIEKQLKSFYQVAVEKRNNEHRFKSYGQQPLPYVFNEVSVTVATNMGNSSYITAEILGPISNLTIGDGQYYHGYYNAPLEPGSMYRVHVRIVTMAMDGKRIYGFSSFVAFTTKELIAVKASVQVNKAQSNAVVGFSVVIIVLVFVIIGLVVFHILKQKKTNKQIKTNETSEMTGNISPFETNEQLAPHYQPLNRCEPLEQDDSCTYEIVSNDKRYQIPKPVSKDSLFTEKPVDEDLYENI